MSPAERLRALVRAGIFCLPEAPLCAVVLNLLDQDESSDFGSSDEHTVIATGLRATLIPLRDDPVTDADVARVHKAFGALGVTGAALKEAATDLQQAGVPS
jgi:hypothetical protein